MKTTSLRRGDWTRLLYSCIDVRTSRTKLKCCTNSNFLANSGLCYIWNVRFLLFLFLREERELESVISSLENTADSRVPFPKTTRKGDERREETASDRRCQAEMRVQLSRVRVLLFEHVSFSWARTVPKSERDTDRQRNLIYDLFTATMWSSFKCPTSTCESKVFNFKSITFLPFFKGTEKKRFSFPWSEWFEAMMLRT